MEEAEQIKLLKELLAVRKEIQEANAELDRLKVKETWILLKHNKLITDINGE